MQQGEQQTEDKDFRYSGSQQEVVRIKTDGKNNGRTHKPLTEYHGDKHQEIADWEKVTRDPERQWTFYEAKHRNGDWIVYGKRDKPTNLPDRVRSLACYSLSGYLWWTANVHKGMWVYSHAEENQITIGQGPYTHYAVWHTLDQYKNKKNKHQLVQEAEVEQKEDQTYDVLKDTEEGEADDAEVDEENVEDRECWNSRTQKRQMIKLRALREKSHRKESRVNGLSKTRELWQRKAEDAEVNKQVEKKN